MDKKRRKNRHKRQAGIEKVKSAMNHMPLKQHLKTLKAAMPVKQKEPEHDSQLPIFRQLKDLTKIREIKSQGIFQNLSFCIPLLDPVHDPPNEKVTEMVKGIFMQGGKMIEYSEKMSEQFSKFVIVSDKSMVAQLKNSLKGLVKYEMMLSYQFVDVSLKRLKKMKIEDYLLYDNTDNFHKETTSVELAKEKLMAEQLSQNLIRPKFVPKDQDLEKAITESYESQKEKKSLCEIGGLHSTQKEKNVEELSYEEFCHKGIDQIQADFDQLSEISDSHEMLESHNSNQLIESSMQLEKQSEKEVQNVPASKFHIKNQQQDQHLEKETKKQKIHEKQKYHRNDKLKSKQAEESKQKTEKKAEDEYQEGDALCPWEPKADRKRFWYIPPKNLASHSFQKNLYICNKLSQLQQIYRRNGDTRNFLYLKVITLIKSHTKQIKDVEDVDQIQGLSKGMKEKIKQILKTGHLSRLNRFTVKQENNVCEELEKVWGIGSKKAKQFYDMGIKTVEDLRKRPELITKNVSVGLKYFDQFAQRIPRDKVTRIFQRFKKIFYNQAHSDKMHQLEVVGSYRRGKATCGDIDVLICRQDGSVEPKLLHNLVLELQQHGFITESLSHPRIFDGRNCSAYMGVCLFEGQHHRIDIKHYPVEQYAFALMYFTGSDIFNRQMRMVAHNKGLLLSDHGIKKKERNGKTKIWKGGEIPVLKTEEQIFKFLEQEYCTPAEREI